MKAFRYLPTLLALSLFTLWSCGQSGDNSTGQNNSTETEANENNGGATTATDMNNAVAQAEKAVKDFQGENADVTPVNFRKLKELLPEKLQGMSRSSHSGESTGAMGMKFSMAEANYEKGDKRMEIKIMDIGGIGIAAMSMAAWSSVEIDREDDRGYERTSTWGAFKAYESCRTGDNFCSLKLYDKRGVVAELEGYNVSIDELKSAAGDLDLDDIPGMRE